MFVARRPKAMPKLQQKLADAALSLAEVAPSEDGSGGEEREAPMAVSLQAHPDKVRGKWLAGQRKWSSGRLLGPCADMKRCSKRCGHL